MALGFRSLRATLLVPFVSLVIAVAVAVTWLTYNAGLRAVDDVSRHLIEDVANRLAQATKQHMATSTVVLNSVAPDAQTKLTDPEFASLSPTMISDVEKRLWLATGLFPESNGYVYYGSETGRFVGIQRDAVGGPEVRLRAQPNEPRKVFRAVSPEQRGPLLREENYDPHTRPWYQLALEKRALVWTPVYRDFTSGQNIVTLAKPVFRSDGTIRGVAATDLSLNRIIEFVRSLSISQNGIAYVVEPSGRLIAASVDAMPTKNGSAVQSDASDPNRRVESHSHPLVRESYLWLRDQVPAITTAARLNAPPATVSADAQPIMPVQHAQYDGALGATHLSVISYKDGAGLDWRFVVAVPRSDHMAPVYRGLKNSILIGTLAVFASLLLGTWVFHRVARDVREVSRAAERLAKGRAPITRIPQRGGEIGALATSVVAIQDALLFDKLTGAFNRTTFNARFEAAVEALPLHEKLAIIYIDLDRFKKVNDRYGHAVGDAVLVKSADRIRKRLRSGDSFARYGGDEFVVLVQGAAAVDVIDAFVDRLRTHLRLGMNVGDHHVAVGASIGVAIYPQDGELLEDLVAVADSRMYGDKKKTAESRSIRKNLAIAHKEQA